LEFPFRGSARREGLTQAKQSNDSSQPKFDSARAVGRDIIPRTTTRLGCCCWPPHLHPCPSSNAPGPGPPGWLIELIRAGGIDCAVRDREGTSISDTQGLNPRRCLPPLLLLLLRVSHGLSSRTFHFGRVVLGTKALVFPSLLLLFRTSGEKRNAVVRRLAYINLHTQRRGAPSFSPKEIFLQLWSRPRPLLAGRR
jgi:hypothetical protein